MIRALPNWTPGRLRNSPWMILILVLVIECSISGCDSMSDSENVRSSDRGVSRVTAGNIVALVDRQADGVRSGSAEIGVGYTAQVTLIAKRCIGLGKGPGAFVAIWPLGTKIVGRGPRLKVVLGRRSVKVGATIDFERSNKQISSGELSDMNALLPEECRSFEKIVIKSFR